MTSRNQDGSAFSSHLAHILLQDDRMTLTTTRKEQGGCVATPSIVGLWRQHSLLLLPLLFTRVRVNDMRKQTAAIVREVPLFLFFYLFFGLFFYFCLFLRFLSLFFHNVPGSPVGDIENSKIQNAESSGIRTYENDLRV